MTSCRPFPTSSSSPPHAPCWVGCWVWRNGGGGGGGAAAAAAAAVAGAAVGAVPLSLLLLPAALPMSLPLLAAPSCPAHPRCLPVPRSLLCLWLTPPSVIFSSSLSGREIRESMFKEVCRGVEAGGGGGGGRDGLLLLLAPDGLVVRVPATHTVLSRACLMPVCACIHPTTACLLCLLRCAGC